MVKYLYTLYKSTIPRGGHIQLYIYLDTNSYQAGQKTHGQEGKQEMDRKTSRKWTGRQAGDGQEDKQEMVRKINRKWTGR